MRRSPSKPLGEEAVREVNRLNRAGYRLAQIAERLGCPERTIGNTRDMIRSRGLEAVCAERRNMDCAVTVFKEVTLAPSNRPTSYDRIQDDTTRALRPRHARGEVGSPEWCKSCDDAFQAAMRRAILDYAAERDQRRAV
jgi:hypothetical protein